MMVVVQDVSEDSTGVLLLEEKLMGDLQTFLAPKKYLMEGTRDPTDDAVNCLAHWIFHQSDGAVLLTSISGVNGVLTNVKFLGDQ